MKIQTYPDGYFDAYEKNNKTLGKKICRMRYSEQSVGIKRYYSALASIGREGIARVIKIPHNSKINSNLVLHVVSKDGEQFYEIIRIQRKPEEDSDIIELKTPFIKYGLGGQP